MTDAAEPEEELLEEIDNPIERLKLLSENDDGLAKYLDAIEVTTPREREMMREISRTRPLAQPDRFPQAHRNMAEALESLARHGYHGTQAGRRAGPLRAGIRWGVQLVARFLVVSHIKQHLRAAPESLRAQGDPGGARVPRAAGAAARTHGRRSHGRGSQDERRWRCRRS